MFHLLTIQYKQLRFGFLGCIFMALMLSLSAQAAPTPTLLFKELYSKVTIRGIEFSPKLKALNGKVVQMQGYMAPPLQPELNFFVLTREPMASCPFCTTAADWPPDIVLVIMPNGKTLKPSTKVLSVRGKLEIGVKEDPSTGFVSLVRIYAQKVSELP